MATRTKAVLQERSMARIRREVDLLHRRDLESRYITFLNPQTNTVLVVPLLHSGIEDDYRTYLTMKELILDIDVYSETFSRRQKSYVYENIFLVADSEGMEVPDSLARKFFQLYRGDTNYAEGLYRLAEVDLTQPANVITVIFKVTPEAQEAMKEYQRSVERKEIAFRASRREDQDLEQYIDNLYLSLPPISGSVLKHEDGDEPTRKRRYAEMYHGIGSMSFEQEIEEYDEVPDYESREYYEEGDKYTGVY